MGIKSNDRMHTPRWQGQSLLEDRHTVDTVQILPVYTLSVDMLSDNPGTWMHHCHVSHHIKKSCPLHRRRIFQTRKKDLFLRIAKLRKYFVDAEKMGLRLPLGINKISEKAFHSKDEAHHQQVQAGMSTKNQKIRYIQCTEAAFTAKKEKSNKWKHSRTLWST